MELGQEAIVRPSLVGVAHARDGGEALAEALGQHLVVTVAEEALEECGGRAVVLALLGVVRAQSHEVVGRRRRWQRREAPALREALGGGGALRLLELQRVIARRARAGSTRRRPARREAVGLPGTDAPRCCVGRCRIRHRRRRRRRAGTRHRGAAWR
eukprot:scaffold55572_cov34-Phaeocystis_antarctica.AAC.2